MSINRLPVQGWVPQGSISEVYIGRHTHIPHIFIYSCVSPIKFNGEFVHSVLIFPIYLIFKSEDRKFI